ncbi:MAG: cyclic nucleotide-binding/CBS domain-containing protein [Actinomycetota bacterium]
MTTVRDVMNPDLVVVTPSATVRQAASGMYARRTGSSLVMDGDRLIGIFTERDIVRALSGTSDHGRTSLVRDRMTPDPQVIAPGATLGEALDRMLTGGFRHLPVVEDDRVIGMVSMRDLAGAISRG